MAYFIEWSGDFQQGGCLYKLTCGIQWTPQRLWRPEEQASEKADQSTFGSGVVTLLMKLLIGNKKFLCHCVSM